VLHFRFSAPNYAVDSFFVCSIRAICVAQHIVPDIPTPISCELLIQEGTYWGGGGLVPWAELVRFGKLIRLLEVIKEDKMGHNGAVLAQ